MIVIQSLTILVALAPSLAAEAKTQKIEDDFRYTSYNDLMAAGGERFSDEGVTSFGQLLFDVKRDQVFAGARDNLYRLSLVGLRRLEKASWDSPLEKVNLCQDKGQSENSCHNYIKILLTDGRKLFACGTNAYSPQCSWRELDNINHILEWVDGVAKCPYNPKANVTALMTDTGHYYVGTPTDFSGSDPAIYRAIGNPAYGGYRLRTLQYNSKWLNEPHFVGSFEDDRFVYFIFREPAVEYMNCGKTIYSRIARVCKNDSGGSSLLKNNWTTFMKARLNCSLPGEYPFYFDSVQSIDYMSDRRLLFAVFTTASNSVPGSAICVFNMSEIEEAFLGPFKHQANSKSIWESQSVPHQEHTQCRNVDSTFTELFDYQLMDKVVQPITSRPIHTANLDFYTHLSVTNVKTKYSEAFIAFVASQDGLVRKLAVMPGMKDTCLVEILKPESSNAVAPLNIMKYLNETNSLYIGSEKSVLRIPASRCGRHLTRVGCLNAQDPMCGWDERRERCTTIPSGSKAHWIQEQLKCPDVEIPLDGAWSAWSPWSECLQEVDDILRDTQETQDKCLCQTRSCTNPTPRNGGKNCDGISIRVSNCTVHGGWTAWSGWSACSATCGVAVKWRRRACGAPTPQYGGRLCVGADRSEIYCSQNPPCPVPVQPILEGGWSEWGLWSACSAPCGGGARWRQRRCDSPPPAPGAPPCPGCAVEAEACNKQPCEVRRASAWTPWQMIQSNNVSSKVGYIEKRYRFSCKAQTADQIKLSLSKEEERYCNGDGTCGSTPALDLSSNGWSAWSQWDACSAECGGGYQTMTRTCLKPPCQGSGNLQRACNVHSCIDGWGCWRDWSPCSVSCGPGRTERRRPCLAPGGCKGDAVQTTLCDGPPCDSLLGWSNWSGWSSCDSSNKQHRNRRCLFKNQVRDSDVCQGPDTEMKLCNSNGINNVAEVLPARYSNQATLTSEDGLGMGLVVGLVMISFLVGALLAAGPVVWIVRRRTPRIPSSPHYITKQNSYVSVPLKEVPKKPMTTFAKPNNINADRDTSLDSPKLYPKAMAGDYETSTVKRNSHATQSSSSCRNNIDVDQDKFY
ncbi:semaphorin 5c-like isoform X2 [Arctopsyche grandis]